MLMDLKPVLQGCLSQDNDVGPPRAARSHRLEKPLALHVKVEFPEPSCECEGMILQVRKRAEEALEAAKGRPDAVPSLASEACTSENVHVRLLAALVLKKWLPSTWPELSPDHQNQLKDALRTRSIEGE